MTLDICTKALLLLHVIKRFRLLHVCFITRQVAKRVLKLFRSKIYSPKIMLMTCFTVFWIIFLPFSHLKQIVQSQKRGKVSQPLINQIQISHAAQLRSGEYMTYKEKVIEFIFWYLRRIFKKFHLNYDSLIIKFFAWFCVLSRMRSLYTINWFRSLRKRSNRKWKSHQKRLGNDIRIALLWADVLQPFLRNNFSTLMFQISNLGSYVTNMLTRMLIRYQISATAQTWR